MDDEDVGHALLKDGDWVKCLSFREFHAAEDEFVRIQREGPFVAFGAGDDDFGAFELLAGREGGLGFGRNRRKSFFDRRFKGSGAFRDEGERAVQQEGEISEPIESLDNEGREGNLVYKIIRVDKIIPAHTATFQNDFTQISEQVKNQLQMKAIDDYLRKKIKDTKVKIDPMFKDCEFRNAGWYDKIKKK